MNEQNNRRQKLIKEKQKSRYKIKKRYIKIKEKIKIKIKFHLIWNLINQYPTKYERK